MKAWKNKQTGSLHDIQTLPGALPFECDPAEWDLVDVTDEEIAAFAQIASYAHAERGIKDLFTETPIPITHNLEELL